MCRDEAGESWLVAILLGCVLVVSACVPGDSGENEESDDSGTVDAVAVITGTSPTTILFPRTTDRWELGEFEASGTRDRVISDLSDLGVVTIVPAKSAQHSGLTVELRVSESAPSGSRTSSVVTYDGESVVLSVSASPVGSVSSCSELAPEGEGDPNLLTGIDVRGKPGCALDRDVAVSRVIWEEHGFRFSAESATIHTTDMIEWLATWELIP